MGRSRSLRVNPAGRSVDRLLPDPVVAINQVCVTNKLSLPRKKCGRGKAPSVVNLLGRAVGVSNRMPLPRNGVWEDARNDRQRPTNFGYCWHAPSGLELLGQSSDQERECQQNEKPPDPQLLRWGALCAGLATGGGITGGCGTTTRCQGGSDRDGSLETVVGRVGGARVLLFKDSDGAGRKKTSGEGAGVTTR